jgi:hypothetical protein
MTPFVLAGLQEKSLPVNCGEKGGGGKLESEMANAASR